MTRITPPRSSVPPVAGVDLLPVLVMSMLRALMLPLLTMEREPPSTSVPLAPTFTALCEPPRERLSKVLVKLFNSSDAAPLLLLLPNETHDRSFAMTSSFSCMLHAALGALRGIGVTRERLGAVAGATAEVIAGEGARMRALAGAGFERVIYLGSHGLRGLARESALKLLELTDGRCVATYDTPLGFRHGPKTVVNPRTLVTVFVSNDPYPRQYDLDLLAELGRDRVAARVIAVTARPVDPIDGVEVVAVPRLAQCDDVDLVVPFVSLAQMLAFHASLRFGLSPDSPNAAGTVNRVVQGVTIHPLG